MELSQQEMELILMPLILKFEEKILLQNVYNFLQRVKTSFENKYWMMQTGEFFQN